MRIALLGLAGAGKTTVFNAVADVPVAAVPGVVQSETHVQVVKVHDPRLDRLREMFDPKKFTPTGLELHDPPGLPPGDGPGEREKRTRLVGALREADAYVLVLRAFSTDAYAYERAAPDPAADLDRLLVELHMSDLLVAQSRAEKLRDNVKKRASSPSSTASSRASRRARASRRSSSGPTTTAACEASSSSPASRSCSS
jgi:ribosome-binding ATPase YchF (GTP1/OBG family)